MNSVLVAAIAFVCLFGGAIVGTFVRRALPEHHLNDASRTLLQMALGIIGTMSDGERLFDYLQSLPVKSDEQRALKSEAITLTIDLGQVRWLMYEQTAESLSSPLLAVLIFWFTITFIGFGLFSPQNATVMVALALGALAVSGAILVMLEMYTPFEGIVQLSSAPLRDALAQLGH